MITVILFEIPTGVVADVFGRKISVIIGLFIQIFFLLTFYFTTNQTILLIAYFFNGIAFTFLSGADEAWLIDYLKHHDQEKNLNKVLSRNASINMIGSFIVNITATIILLLFKESIGLSQLVRNMILVEVIAVIIGLLIAVFTEEPYFKKKKIKSYFKYSIKESKVSFNKSIKELKGNKKVIFIILGSSFFLFGGTVIASGWQIQLNNNGINESYNGLITGIAKLLSFALLLFNSKITDKIGLKKTLLIFPAIMGVCQIIFSLNIGFWLIIFYLIINTFWNVFFNNMSVKINKSIKSENRATIMSFKGITDYFPSMLGQVILFGLITDLSNINTSLFIGSLFYLLSILFFKKG